MKTFILIDGNAILHRAYHAMPTLTSKAGEPVNAVYGFFTMLLTILHNERPTYLSICFDRSKPTIRQSLYAGYHAHRPEMTSDLSSQFTLIDRLLASLKVAVFGLDGYEGDDLIGTLSVQAQSEKCRLQVGEVHTVIVTGDRDLLQLVNARTRVLMPITGLTKTVLFDEAKVEEKYGVKPEQFIDYKALIGDASDGYPGVTGIGPKTASNLLKQFGTFEALYERIGEIPEGIGTKLALDAEQAALAKRLATIITDAPIRLDIDRCRTERLDLHALHDEFQRLGFKSLTTKLETWYPQLKEAPKPKKNDPDGQMDIF